MSALSREERDDWWKDVSYVLMKYVDGVWVLAGAIRERPPTLVKIGERTKAEWMREVRSRLATVCNI